MTGGKSAPGRNQGAGDPLRAAISLAISRKGPWHREARSQRSDKYYYVISGELSFTLEGVEHILTEGGFCRVPL